jgi:hypothetical protein
MFLLSACTPEFQTRRPGPSYPGHSVPEVAREAAVPAPVSDVDGVLNYYHRVLALKGPELGREYERARQDFEQIPSEVHRLRLAILLSVPGAAFRDESAAIGLLQSLVKDGSEETPLKSLAELLQNFILEQRRTEDALQAQSAKLRDEQRRAEALQQKLEALLQMEMNMIEREQAAQPRKR